MNALDYVRKQFNHNLVNLLGAPVSNEQAQERIEVCNSCEYKAVGIFGDKCSICSCPLNVKPFFESHILSAINITAERDENDRTKVICPYPNKNKWDEIDKKYLIAKNKK